MSDFKVAPKNKLTMVQLQERYQLTDASVLSDWTKLHGIDLSEGVITPPEVDLLDHTNHHINVLGMTIDEYKQMLRRHAKDNCEDRSISQPPIEVKKTPSAEAVLPLKSDRYVAPPSAVLDPDQLPGEMQEAVQKLTEEYAEAIDFLAERIADNFIEELDVAVMRHLVSKVQERQNTRLKNRPNNFLQTIKSIIPGAKGTLLLKKSSEEPGVELEGNHRLG